MEENDENNTLIPGSPFRIVKYMDGNYNLQMGRYRLNEKQLKSKKEVIEYIDENAWNIVGQMVILILNDQIETANKEMQKRQEEQRKTEKAYIEQTKKHG